MIPLALGIIWLCGVMVVLAVWGVRWRQVAKTLRRAVRVEDGREWEILRRLHKAMGAGWQIPLLMSQKLMEPGMFGVFRPVLIWPERLSERLDDEHIEAILAHELRHARRKDNLTAVIHMVVEAAFWFHPLVWWMERRMVEERERACDEAVVEMGSRPGVYAESLLKACRFCVESPLVCVAGVTGADLAMRVRKIMTESVARRLGWGRKMLLAAVGLTVVAVPILLGQVKGARAVAEVKAAARAVQTTAMAAAAPIESAQANAPQAAPSPSQAAPTPAAVTSPTASPVLPEMRFDVAVIRPSPPDAHMLTAPHGTAEDFSARMATVESMIGFAYDIPTVLGMSVDPAHFFLPHASNLVGGPGWVGSDKYDLTAKADEATIAAWSKLPEKEQTEELRSMMRALLAERFHLTMRHETREMLVWALVVAKGGPKFGATKGPPADLNDGEDGTKPYDKSKPYQTRWKLDHGLVEGRDVTIDDFKEMLWGQREIDSHKILDQTGLKGKYDLKLKWASVDDPREPDGPSLFTAIQEQLGLKLESTKAPMDVLVIDHIERPSEN
jgi:uncharacterized protein (TIGR03435 family)